MSDEFHLVRFLDAQKPIYSRVLAELLTGKKRSHWMWFIFPQIWGLGSSEMAERYAIQCGDEAVAYLAHPVLGARLRECTRAVLDHPDKSLKDIFGSPDDMKFRSSMTLFDLAEADSIFQDALQAFCEGEPCYDTLTTPM